MSQANSSENSPPALASSFTGTQWLIIIVAIIGFAFDIFELLMLPLIAQEALMELLKAPSPDDPKITEWLGYLLYVPAVAGGAFGLLGGWFVDRFGRKRMLVVSILLYGLSPMAAAFSTSVTELLFYRCLTFIGVCIEFVAAVTWLAELFPNPKQREAVLGFTQAFSSFGGLMVTGASMMCLRYAPELPALSLPEGFDGHAVWRYTLITGMIPAAIIMVLLWFLPESPVWAAKKAAGELKRPTIRALFTPELRRTTITASILLACAYAAAFGAIQLTPPRISRGVPELAEANKSFARLTVELKQTKAKLDNSTDPNVKKKLGSELKEIAEKRKEVNVEFAKVKDTMQFWQEIGGLLGRIGLAGLVLVLVSRRYQLLCLIVPGLITLPVVFAYLAFESELYLRIGLATAAFWTIAQYSFWGNYLPAAYPVHLRGTAGGFAVNVGGRMVGTFAAFITTVIVAPLMPGGRPDVITPAQVAYAAALVGGGVYLIALATWFFLPEPKSSGGD